MKLVDATTTFYRTTLTFAAKGALKEVPMAADHPIRLLALHLLGPLPPPSRCTTNSSRPLFLSSNAYVGNVLDTHMALTTGGNIENMHDY